MVWSQKWHQEKECEMSDWEGKGIKISHNCILPINVYAIMKEHERYYLRDHGVWQTLGVIYHGKCTEN